MTPFDLKKSLESIVLIVDTREQPTDKYKARLKEIGYPVAREKLNSGDYSIKCTLPNGEPFTLADKIVIERKMDLDELCQCLGGSRKRFEREFARAKEAGTKIYLLVENGSWEKAFKGQYQSLMKPQALIASINAFRARYDMQLDFCESRTTGQLIREILYRELKEHLEGLEYDG